MKYCWKRGRADCLVAFGSNGRGFTTRTDRFGVGVVKDGVRGGGNFTIVLGRPRFLFGAMCFVTFLVTRCNLSFNVVLGGDAWLFFLLRHRTGDTLSSPLDVPHCGVLSFFSSSPLEVAMGDLLYCTC